MRAGQSVSPILCSRHPQAQFRTQAHSYGRMASAKRSTHRWRKWLLWPSLVFFWQDLLCWGRASWARPPHRGWGRRPWRGRSPAVAPARVPPPPHPELPWQVGLVCGCPRQSWPLAGLVAPASCPRQNWLPRQRCRCRVVAAKLAPGLPPPGLPRQAYPTKKKP